MTQKVKIIISEFINGKIDFDEAVSRLKENGFNGLEAKFELKHWLEKNK